jgi:hypothetical protein
MGLWKGVLDRMKRLKQLAITAAMGAMLLLGRGVARADEPKEPTKEGLEFFERNIRPVLSDSCYKCHSVAAKEKKKLKAKLYLDSWAGIAKGGESGDPAVVPGEPDKSLLIKAIRYKFTGDDEDQNMPPKLKDGSGGKLPDETIQKFEEWVKMGAPYPKEKAQGPDAPVEKAHWAFEVPREPAVPQVKEAARVQGPIDAFVMSKLEEKGLTLNPPADKRTLIRRATLDLTGLPPTPAEVDGFLQDNAPDAFSKVVDRLLASPRYGERWGRHWLDVARYSDTKGYVFEEDRRYPFAYTYRDYVVNAFNTDLPYDQFLIQQIAADKLDLGADKRPLAAMGFLTLGRRFLNQAPDIIDDRLDVICRGTMALTIGCARCHDHKFDPIPTKDYYSLYGVLDSSTEPKELPLLATPASTPASLAFEKELEAREAAVETYKHDHAQAILADARKPAAIAEYLIGAQTAGREGGEAKDDLNHYLLARYRTLLGTTGAKDPVMGPWHAYAALPAAEFAARSQEVTEKLFNSTGQRPAFNPLLTAAFIGKPPASLGDVAERYGSLLARVAGTDKRDDSDEESLRLALYGEHGPLAVPAPEYTRLFKKDGHLQVTRLQKNVDAWIAESPDAPARAMVLTDSPDPHDAPLHVRGSATNVGQTVPRHFLTALSHGGTPQPLTEGSGRLQLARAIASRDNPLTARVLVNRVWLYHFGKGIVRTPSDFGTRCDPPTHPELLDWLALRFMDSGWSIKKLHRQVLLSAAYQQSDDDNPAARAVDPDNLLLWRMNRQRLDFESTRDSLLAVAGTLDDRLGGRSGNLADPADARRTIYGTIDRQNLPSLFRAFDFASPDTTSPQRFTTTVPQQALYFMNSPFVIRQAKALAARPDVGPADPEARVRLLYRTLFARDATPEEISTGLQYVEAESTAPTSEPIWQYGYGRFDMSMQRVVDFSPLPYFTGTSWQGGPRVPDQKLGFVILTPGGGHPGNDAEHATVRRWTAPLDATIRISATLEHPAEQGDGVRARIVSSRSGLLGEWSVHHGSVRTAVAGVKVQSGDTIDFVVDCRDNNNSDSFAWSPTIQAASGSSWSASADFEGAPAPKLSPWEKYTQVLMESNEFVFVD